MERLSALMEANLADADLNIDYLAREMGYSRTAFAGLWRPDGAWEGAPGEEGAPRD